MPTINFNCKKIQIHQSSVIVFYVATSPGKPRYAMAKSQKVEEDSTEKTKESTTARAANTARWRNRQAEKDANIIAAYNKHREKMNLPSISLHFRHSVPFKGGARPNYMASLHVVFII